MDVGIIGLGVVGGSVAKALKSADPNIRLVGIEKIDEIRGHACTSGLFDEIHHTIVEQLNTVDVIFVCVPIEIVERVFKRLEEMLESPKIISDVTGIKTPMLQLAATYLSKHHYIGTHPMAGGQKGGFSNARADMFQNAVVAVCPTEDTDPAAVEAITKLWKLTGARALTMSPQEHDETIATTSHLPYLIAITLTEHAHSPDAPQLAGGSYRDATLRADFAPEIMAPILAKNGFLPSTVGKFAERLLELSKLLEENPDEFARRADEARNQRKSS